MFNNIKRTSVITTVIFIYFYLFWLFFSILFFIKIPIKIIIISLLIILLVILPSAYISLLERQLVGILQQRFGPIYAGGLFSLINPILDGLKLFLRKNNLVKNNNKFFNIKLMSSYTVWVSLSIFWIIYNSDYLNDYKYNWVLYILIVLLINSYGIFLASLISSNNKYMKLSTIRLVALIISYDIIIGSIFLIPCITWNSFNISDIIWSQKNYPFVFILLPVFFLFLILLFTEWRKVPFDVVESESEMASEYLQEISGIPFALLIISEYISLFFLFILLHIFFFGQFISSYVISLLVIFCVLIFFLILRTMLPNYRFDQIITIYWKILFPLTLIFILLIGLYL